MSAGSFKQDGIGWRIGLLQRKVSEWIEYQTSQVEIDSPDWNLENIPWKLLWLAIKFLLWGIVTLLAVWILWQSWLFIRIYWKRWQRKSDRSWQPVPELIPEFSSHDWLDKSQAARINANYRQAIFCLYQAMLQLLDERKIVPAQLSRTDGEYGRSLHQTATNVLPAYELLLSIHQRLCFSRAEASHSLYEQCQQAYQQIANQT